MATPTLFLPVENQVRELDARLLLACFGAARGYRSVVGWKSSVDAYINEFQPGVYFAKSVTARAVPVLRINRQLGHHIIAWDEEALVHYPSEVYYPRRLDGKALSLTNQLLAWGEDNRSMVEEFPDYPGTPLDIVGNPRGDMLRTELRGYFDEQVAALRKRHGAFILVNTNFGVINGYFRELNIARPEDGAPDGLALGLSAKGLPRDFALEIYHHRTSIFEAFQEMMPILAKAYPEHTIILRPHPAENWEFWKELLSEYDNISVIAEGNVVPWLLACSTLIHNGCTTAVESYILDRPVIAYEPSRHEVLNLDLPNSLSVRCQTVDEVIAQVGQVLYHGYENNRSTERTAILNHFVSALDGPFASNRILDLVDRDLNLGSVPIMDRIRGEVCIRKRRWSKQLKTRCGLVRHAHGFKQQRFPEIAKSDLLRRCQKLGRLAGLDGSVQIDMVRPDIFAIKPA